MTMGFLELAGIAVICIFVHFICLITTVCRINKIPSISKNEHIPKIIIGTILFFLSLILLITFFVFLLLYYRNGIYFGSVRTMNIILLTTSIGSLLSNVVGSILLLS